MNPLHDAILARLPASMQELAAASGVQGEPLWAAVRTLRQAGIILRKGAHGDRTYVSAEAEAAANAEPRVIATEHPADAIREEKKQRKRPVILFWIPGWPSQDPDRRMVWAIIWNGGPTAEHLLKKLKRRFKKEAEWEISFMSPASARKLKTKSIGLRDILERQRERREAAVADAGAGVVT